VQDGIHLPSAKTRLRLDQRMVAEIMKTPALLLESETTVREALDAFAPAACVPPGHGCARRHRVVTQSQLEVEADEDSGRLLDDLMVAPLFPHMHADQELIWR